MFKRRSIDRNMRGAFKFEKSSAKLYRLNFKIVLSIDLKCDIMIA